MKIKARSKNNHPCSSSSYATEWLKGKNINEAAKLQNQEIASHLNLPPIICSTLIIRATSSHTIVIEP
eukprot:1370240-Amorphochlora_amoeboformis.AAC.3